MEAPYTKKRAVQYRGPSTSDDYNKRIEENYNDLVVLFNRARLSEVELDELYRRMAKDQLSMARVIDHLEERIEALEAAEKRFTFYDTSQIDDARFDDDEQWEIPAEDRLTYDTQYGLLTLPKVETSSQSKLFFVDTEGKEVVPSSLETRVVADSSTADNSSSIVESSSPEYALYRRPGLIWERNVISSSESANGAALTLYVKVPTDLFTTAKSNAIVVHPFPFFGCTIKEISYTLRVDPMLDESDGYMPFNALSHYFDEAPAKGWVIPGGWANGEDAAVDTGPRTYYFEPKQITAFRITLHQPTHYREAGKFVYSYGLSHLDLRYDKFLSEGRTMIRFDAPEGETISSINDVQPQIWNVSPAALSRVFDYRVLWQMGDGSYDVSDTPPLNASSVWIEVTLKNTDGWTPALSSLTVDYS